MPQNRSQNLVQRQNQKLLPQRSPVRNLVQQALSKDRVQNRRPALRNLAQNRTLIPILILTRNQNLQQDLKPNPTQKVRCKFVFFVPVYLSI